METIITKTAELICELNGPPEQFGLWKVDGKFLTDKELANLQQLYAHVSWIKIRFTEPNEYKKHYPSKTLTNELSEL